MRIAEDSDLERTLGVGMLQLSAQGYRKALKVHPAGNQGSRIPIGARSPKHSPLRGIR